MTTTRSAEAPLINGLPGRPPRSPEDEAELQRLTAAARGLGPDNEMWVEIREFAEAADVRACHRVAAKLLVWVLIGKDPSRDAEWLGSVEDLKALAEWLASGE